MGWENMFDFVQFFSCVEILLDGWKTYDGASAHVWPKCVNNEEEYKMHTNEDFGGAISINETIIYIFRLFGIRSFGECADCARMRLAVDGRWMLIYKTHEMNNK